MIFAIFNQRYVTAGVSQNKVGKNTVYSESRKTFSPEKLILEN